jgi:hypothetical protein
MNLRRELSDGERQHSRELFKAAYQATAGRTDPRKLVYPYDFKTAVDRTESSYYNVNCELNAKCANGIDRLINKSCYETNRYNLELAAMSAIIDYGFPRVCSVLAFNYHNRDSGDIRFTTANRDWISGFRVQKESLSNARLQAHAILIDGFCDYVRELYQDLGAERFALPGNEESGEFVKGYEIKRAITTSDDGEGFFTGYAIGHNPEAVSPWVCWQFAVRDGARHYNWGDYASVEQTAIDSYNTRVFVALN